MMQLQVAIGVVCVQIESSHRWCTCYFQFFRHQRLSVSLESEFTVAQRYLRLKIGIHGGNVVADFVHLAKPELEKETVCEVFECSFLLADVEIQVSEVPLFHSLIIDGGIKHGDAVALFCNHLSLKVS